MPTSRERRLARIEKYGPEWIPMPIRRDVPVPQIPDGMKQHKTDKSQYVAPLLGKDLPRIPKGFRLHFDYRIRYPFKDLEVGDSFIFPEKIRRGFNGRISGQGVGHRKFVTSKVHNDWIRVWRTE